MADFTRSIELNDTAAKRYHGRAMLNYEIKDYAAAIDDFNKVVSLGRETMWCYLTWACPIPPWRKEKRPSFRNHVPWETKLMQDVFNGVRENIPAIP